MSSNVLVASAHDDSVDDEVQFVGVYTPAATTMTTTTTTTTSGGAKIASDHHPAFNAEHRQSRSVINDYDDDDVQCLQDSHAGPAVTPCTNTMPPPVPIARTTTAATAPRATAWATTIPSTQQSPSLPQSSTTTNPSKIMRNPYLKKNNINNNNNKRGADALLSKTATFIGGAEAARRNARLKKPRATPIASPIDRQRLNESLLRHCPGLSPMERFGAALLRTSPCDFVASEEALGNGSGGSSSVSSSSTSLSSVALDVWGRICQRLDLQAAMPMKPLPERYDSKNAKMHFAVRAALVLEEARTAIAQPLVSQWGQKRGFNNNGNNSRDKLVVTAKSIHKNAASGHVQVTFRKSTPLSKEELFSIRPGGVYQCLPRDSQQKLQDILLGLVTTSPVTRDSLDSVKHEFSLHWFRDIPNRIEDTEWVLTPLTPLISELRCFEALTSPDTLNVPFLLDLLGRDPNKPEPERLTGTRTVFDENGNPQIQGRINSNTKNTTIPAFFPPAATSNNQAFRMPKLNDTQSAAANKFLQSDPETITLIQGPPGTGKTTLLVSIICRYLLEQPSAEKKRRLLVCAPTNKAVTVLATRFMAAMNPDKCRYNALLVGDGDKLLAEERGSNNNKKEEKSEESPEQLKSIFVFSWLQSLIDDYRKISKNQEIPRAGGARAEKMSPSDLHKLASRLEKRIKSNLGIDVLSSKAELVTKATGVSKLASRGDGNNIATSVDSLVKDLDGMKKNASDHITKVLVTSADVLFCTLASAGGIILKSHLVDDLIVDEAAAATEPELCIPFHMQPKRMLCVGDPLQLPATVLSRRAVDLGLSMSLHERLMYRCQHPYIMLDVQYRMNPKISSFPSMQFYDSKISNGENVLHSEYGSRVSLVDGSPYIFMNVNGREERGAGGSHKNHVEALCVVDLILELKEAARRNNRSISWNSANRVRVITFYQAQVSHIKMLLKKRGGDVGDVVVATVDSSQGCEADIVIVSFVRSSPNSGPGFLSDNRRMNVALTRAKYQLICVGNLEGLASMTNFETLHRLANNALHRNVVRQHYRSSSTTTTNNRTVNQRLENCFGANTKSS
ncbi:hypothetical protein ACA910_001126 [Epithemia clementina (nom. ined.)]